MTAPGLSGFEGDQGFNRLAQSRMSGSGILGKGGGCSRFKGSNEKMIYSMFNIISYDLIIHNIQYDILYLQVCGLGRGGCPASV